MHIYTHIMLYIYTVFIFTFTYYTLTVILLVCLYRPLQENWSKSEIFFFFSPYFYFWLDNSSETFLFLLLCTSWVKKMPLGKVERVSHRRAGRLQREEKWGRVETISADIVYIPSGSAQQMSRDTLGEEVGGVVGRKLAGSDWVQWGRGLFSSRSGGNCPRNR